MTNAQQSTQLGTTKRPTRGFALPTILIASIVMLLVLLASVTSTTAVRTAMKDQYYAQLAQVAGEAGVSYAQACLDASARIPTWSNALPLKSNTNCSGVEIVSCPTSSTDFRCSVTRNGNVRSNFSVGLPLVDADGRATTVPNTGYVEVLRTSNDAVWRRYNQKSSPTAAVPELCSGSATGQLGWNNAVVVGTGSPFPESSAQQISNTASSLPGPMYFRKDFSVMESGTFTFNNKGDDLSEVYIDGQLASTVVWSAVQTNTINLGVGCHTIVVRLTNKGILANPAGLNFSLKLAGASSPLVVSDRSWRVTSGNQVHYSDVNYFADPAVWTPVRDVNSAIAMIGTWTSISGDTSARWISTTHSYDGSGNYPTNQFTLMRDDRIISLDANTSVKVTMYCDDSCYPYLDGNLVNSGIASGPVSFNLTMASGTHKFALLFGNGAGPSAFAFAAVSTDGKTLSSSDDTWSAANFWSATNPTSTYSYDNSYDPVPDPVTVDVLVVAGGGSGGGSTGGGGGGGGVILTKQGFTNPASYPVVIGAGGAIPGNQAIGRSGANSTFNGLTAIGGGGGGYTSTITGVAGGLNGGSGGGGQNYYTTSAPGRGTLSQGNPGGALGASSASGGGGAGGTGTITSTAYYGGTGGIGRSSSISGALQYYSGGGGGGGNLGAAGGNGGGGAGASGNALGTNATVNTGGGGGAGWGYASSNGGAGGSGIVIIAYPTGSISATGGTVTTFGGKTIHKFTSSGTFTVN